MLSGWLNAGVQVIISNIIVFSLSLGYFNWLYSPSSMEWQSGSSWDNKLF